MKMDEHIIHLKNTTKSFSSHHAWNNFFNSEFGEQVDTLVTVSDRLTIYNGKIELTGEDVTVTFQTNEDALAFILAWT